MKNIRSLPAIPLLVVCGILLSASTWWVLPRITDGTHEPPIRDESRIAVPFRQNSPETRGGLLTFKLELGFLHPSLFRITPDNCVESLRINEQDVTEGIAFCDLAGRTFDLGPYLRSGTNTLAVQLTDDGGVYAFDLQPSAQDPLWLCIILLWGLLAGFVLMVLIRPLKLPRTEYAAVLILFAGIMLRMVYVLATPLHERAYDWDGHVEYIQYMAERWQIPEATKGWQFYQPPLYYFIGALAWKALSAAGAGYGFLIKSLQLQALLFSGAALFFGWLIARLLFPDRRKLLPVALFTALLASAPSLVFASSRINNDLLLLLISFAFAFFLLRFWQRGMAGDWYLACLLISAGILTKSNALPFLPIAFSCLLLRPKLTFLRKMRMGALSLLMIAVLTGWLFALRFGIENERFIVGNRLNDALLVKNEIPYLTVFHPLEILKHPYNHNWIDDERRQYVWEYLYKSAFVGEWGLGDRLRPLVTVLEAMGLVLIALMLWGIVRDLSQKKWGTSPLLSILVFTLLAMLGFRITSPYASSQELRYIPILLLPFAYYTVTGVLSLPRRLRHAAYIFTGLFCPLCTAYIFLLLKGL